MLEFKINDIVLSALLSVVDEVLKAATTPVKNVGKVYSLYPSPLFNVEVCQQTSMTPYCLSGMFTNTSTLIWGRGGLINTFCVPVD